MSLNILFFDDQPAGLTAIVSYMGSVGYQCILASNREAAEKEIQSGRFDIAVLDGNLLPQKTIDEMKYALTKEGKEPYIEEEAQGIKFARWISENYPDLGIIIYSSELTSLEDQITGLNYGADHYVLKPEDPQIFEARVRSILRRTKPKSMDSLYFRNFALNLRSGLLIFSNDGLVELTDAEFKTLRTMVLAPREIHDRSELCRAALGRHLVTESDRAIDTLISKLRKKLEEETGTIDLISTIRGEGYRFNAEVSKNPLIKNEKHATSDETA